jgi:mRNA deadenylase 3'-5' endonuclease subunit Ccr4
MSYNLMADKIVKERSVHLTEDNPCLKPEYRRRRIMSEIYNANSDILCLQEVANFNDPFYREELEKLGYTIIRETHKEQEI